VGQCPPVFAAFVALRFAAPGHRRMFYAVHIVMQALVAHPRVFFLPNWRDSSHRDEALQARERKPSKFYVLYVGKPSYIKGFSRFVELRRLIDGEDIEFVATVPPDSLGPGDGNIKCLGMV